MVKSDQCLRLFSSRRQPPLLVKISFVTVVFYDRVLLKLFDHSSFILLYLMLSPSGMMVVWLTGSNKQKTRQGHDWMPLLKFFIAISVVLCSESKFDIASIQKYINALHAAETCQKNVICNTCRTNWRNHLGRHF